MLRNESSRILLLIQSHSSASHQQHRAPLAPHVSLAGGAERHFQTVRDHVPLDNVGGGVRAPRRAHVHVVERRLARRARRGAQRAQHVLVSADGRRRDHWPILRSARVHVAGVAAICVIDTHSQAVDYRKILVKNRKAIIHSQCYKADYAFQSIALP